MRFIKYLLIWTILIIVIINFSFIALATLKKEDYKFMYRKIFSTFIKEEEKKQEPPKIFFPDRFRISEPGHIFKSKLFEKEMTFEDLQKIKIYSTIGLTIDPVLDISGLDVEEEWQPLSDDGVDHLIDQQFPKWETHLKIFGRQNLGFTYGMAHFLVRPKYADATASSSGINRGFKPNQSLEIHIKGKVGKKVTIDIDSSGRQEQDTYKVEYNAVKKKEFIQNITAGNIGVSIPGSSYASGSGGGTKNAFGIKATAQKDDWKFQAIASMTRGITEVKHFKGTSRLVVRNIRDYDFRKKKYYILNKGKSIQRGSLSIYLDDNIEKNNFSTIPIPFIKKINEIETNDCDLLFSGTDYIIDYDRGFVEFKRSISDIYDIIVSYNRDGVDYPDFYTDPDIDKAYTNIMIVNNKKFTFLHRRSTISPYEYKGVYSIGNRNIQKEDEDFQFFILDQAFRKLDNQPFVEIESEIYSKDKYGYYIDERTGYIIFDTSEPFLFTDSYYSKSENRDKSIYGYNPNRNDSYYYIHIEYRYESRDFSLHWDVIPESEMVFLNGRKLTRNKDYTIDYTTGHLEFSSEVIITPDSEIDIVYEYLPFGGGLQQILAGLRVDYTPFDWLKLGSVGFYNGKQAPARVPTPKNASDSRWVGSVFGNVTFDDKSITKGVDYILPWKIKNVPVTLSARGEYAGSYYNINTFGQAMLDDFEGTIDTYSCSMRENSWYLSAYIDPAQKDTRGKLYYKDYRDYDDDEDNPPLRTLDWTGPKKGIFNDKNLVPGDDGYNWNKIEYTSKPGPYNADEGHLDAEQLKTRDTAQRSLVFDYDFTNCGGNGWVGVIKKDAFRGGGKDFRDYTDLVLWVKLIGEDPGTKSEVKLRVDIGTFSEDIDSDGILDEEMSKEEGGFKFNNLPGKETTWIGGGPKYVNSEGEYLSANGILDTEDLDQNGYLDKVINEQSNISWPGNIGGKKYAITEHGKDELIIEEGGWRLYRITLSRDILDKDQENVLRRIKHIRIFIQQRVGNKGKLLINKMYFSGLTWREKKVNEQPSTFSNQKNFNAYVISTHDPALEYKNPKYKAREYRENSLRKWDEDGYEDLHGPQTEEEAAQDVEQAIVIEYNNLSKHDFTKTIKENYSSADPDRYTAAYISRNYSTPIDMRYYEKIKFWVYIPSEIYDELKGEYIFLRFGGVNSYYEFRKELNWTNWKKIEVDLRSEEFKKLQPRENKHGKYTDENGVHDPDKSFRVVRIPNLRLVNYIAIGIYGSPKVDGASGIVWVNDLYLDNVQKLSDKAYSYNFNFNVLKHLSMSYSHSYKGKNFSSVGGLGTGKESTRDSINGRWSTLNWMPVTGSWTKSIEETDPEDDIFLPINQQGLSISRNLTGGVGINLPSNPLLRSLYAQYWPNINLTGSLASSTNRKPIPWLLNDDEYKITRISKSYSYAWNGNMKVPLFDTLLNSTVNYQIGRSESESESRALTYYPATNLLGEKVYTNYYTKTNYNFSRTIAWNHGGSYSTKGFSLTPRYNKNYSLSRTAVKSNWNLISRRRSLSTGLSLPKLLIITPKINYSLGYSESSFRYKGPRENPRGPKEPLDDYENYDNDPNLYKNANTSQSYSLNIGSFNIDWFIFKRFTPSYSQTMGFSQTDISVKTNTMFKTWKNFDDKFLWKIPGNYFYIPYIKEHFRSFDFVRNYRPEDNEETGERTVERTTLNMGNTFSFRLRLDFFKVSPWAISYSLNQNTSRSYSSYSLSHSWSLTGSSSFNLMKIFNFWLWKQKKGEYVKSSSLSYGASLKKTNGFLQKSIQYTVTPNCGFQYKWKADKQIAWSLNYSYNVQKWSSHTNFYKIIEEDYGKDFRTEIEPDPENLNTYPPKIGKTWKFSTSYKYSTDLPEEWTPPLFFKKPIKLGFKVAHTTSLGYNRRTYDYGKEKDEKEDNIHPKELVHQILINHSFSLIISKNISGGGSGKLVYDMTREERGELGNKKDDVEQMLSWQIGLNLTIKF